MDALVSVVVPCFNEEQSVAVLAEGIRGVMNELSAYEYECIFVNDGSTDGTRAAIDAICSDNSAFQAIHFRENCGQSAALMAGMERTQGDYILTIDGDLQGDPVDFPKVLELLQQYDCVCGYRADRRDSWMKKTSSRVANSVRNAILRDGIRDAGCGTKGFRRVCLDHFPKFNGVHRFFPALVRRAGLTVVEFPATHHPRVNGASHYGIHDRLWRGLFDIAGVAWLTRRSARPHIEEEQ